MSDYIWGKIKLKEKMIFNNYQRNNILVYFTDKKIVYFNVI